MDHPVELLIRPEADARPLIGGDVWRDHEAEGRVERQAPRESRLARPAVAGHAVGGVDEVFAVADGVGGTWIPRHQGVSRACPRRARAGYRQRQGKDGARDAPLDRPSAHGDRLSEAEGQGASATHPDPFTTALYRSVPDLKVM